MTPSQLLKSRGILETALQYGWIEQAEYWSYPVYNSSGEVIAHRLKRYPHSKAPAKYLWQGEKPTNPDADWYILPNTPKAIKAAQGVAWLANGEPSLLAYHAAGVHNVIATTLSEITVPKSLITMLQVLGINRLLYPVDKDKAGHDSAVKWRDALRGSAIDFEALSWSEDMPEKADANDAWIACEFDSKRFTALLSSLQPLDLPLPEAPLVQTSNVTITETPEGLINVLIGALGVSGFKPNGWSRGFFKCPHHADNDTPNAGISKDTGIVSCFVCGTHSPQSTAEQLGIDWQRFYPQKEAKKPPQRVSRPMNSLAHLTDDETTFTSSIVGTCMYLRTAYPAGYYDSFIAQDELPLSWIKAMLHLSHSKSMTVIVAMRLHQAIRKGQIDPNGFTIKDLMAALDIQTRRVNQGAIDTLIAWGFLLILDTIESFKYNRVTETTKKGGRPEIYYRINTDTDGLRYALMELLEPYLLERLSQDDIAPLLPSLRDSIKGMDRATWKGLQDKHLEEKTRLIQDIISEWSSDVLENVYSPCFADSELESPHHLRMRLIRDYLSQFHEGVQLSRSKLSLLLGCSESYLSKLYEDAGIGVKRMRGWHEVTNPNGCDIQHEMDKAPSSLNQKLGGVSIAIRGKLFGGKYTNLIYANKADAWVTSNTGYIEKLYIWVEQPSLLWVMSAEELAEKAKEEAKIAAQKELDSKADNELPIFVAKEEKEPVEIVEDTPMPKEKKVRKQRAVCYQDRTWQGHKPDFVRETVAKYIHCYTPYSLQGLQIIHLETGVVIAQLENLGDAMRFIVERGFTKRVRTAESYAHPEKDAPVFVPF